MALIQNGPPEWVFERTPDPLKWEVIEMPAPDGPHSVYQLRLLCGLRILCMQVFNHREMWNLVDTISAVLQKGNHHGRTPPARDGSQSR